MKMGWKLSTNGPIDALRPPMCWMISLKLKYIKVYSTCMKSNSICIEYPEFKKFFCTGTKPSLSKFFALLKLRTILS